MLNEDSADIVIRREQGMIRVLRSRYGACGFLSDKEMRDLRMAHPEASVFEHPSADEVKEGDVIAAIKGMVVGVRLYDAHEGRHRTVPARFCVTVRPDGEDPPELYELELPESKAKMVRVGTRVALQIVCSATS